MDVPVSTGILAHYCSLPRHAETCLSSGSRAPTGTFVRCCQSVIWLPPTLPGSLSAKFGFQVYSLVR
ncbi:hypothetical protein XELAEV_18003794mg [Xenopus laevis]|uniref:Uncharacterized protein n=1 Tax=Xenopus laevis TaxID=8355 RepID=A0A974GY42_XENLA|nr:hypothetical protein XELAEV_18003794mg [Xenopus laevis]